MCVCINLVRLYWLDTVSHGNKTIWHFHFLCSHMPYQDAAFTYNSLHILFMGIYVFPCVLSTIPCSFPKDFIRDAVKCSGLLRFVNAGTRKKLRPESFFERFHHEKLKKSPETGKTCLRLKTYVCLNEHRPRCDSHFVSAWIVACDSDLVSQLKKKSPHIILLHIAHAQDYNKLCARRVCVRRAIRE